MIAERGADMLTRTFLIIISAALAAHPGYGQPRRITVNDAIQAALENNANVQISMEQEVQAQARSREQRATFLPNFTGAVSYSDQVINLGSRGLDFPGLPSRVGPFQNTDARLQFSEPLDLSLIRRYQSLKRAAESATFDAEA